MPTPPNYDHVRVSYVRCANCNTRHSLAKKLCDYVRIPRCRSCGKRHWWADGYRIKRRREERKQQCNPGRCGCSMYHFPHRRGSGFCMFNPNVTEDMERDRTSI